MTEFDGKDAVVEAECSREEVLVAVIVDGLIVSGSRSVAVADSRPVADSLRVSETIVDMLCVGVTSSANVSVDSFTESVVELEAISVTDSLYVGELVSKGISVSVKTVVFDCVTAVRVVVAVDVNICPLSVGNKLSEDVIVPEKAEVIEPFERE